MGKKNYFDQEAKNRLVALSQSVKHDLFMLEVAYGDYLSMTDRARAPLIASLANLDLAIADLVAKQPDPEYMAPESKQRKG